MHPMLRFLPLGLSLSCVSRDTVSTLCRCVHDGSLVGTVYTGMRLRSSVTLHLPTVSPLGGATTTIEVKLKTIAHRTAAAVRGTRISSNIDVKY